MTLVLVALSAASSGLAQATAENPGSRKAAGSVTRELPNYDIRLDKSNEAVQALAQFRQADSAPDSRATAGRDAMARAEGALRSSHPGLRLEYAREIRVPEVISPDLWQTRVESLRPPHSAGRAATLRAFIKDHRDFLGVDPGQADRLHVVADYSNPSGNMGFALLEQRINGIPVFRGEIKAGYRADGSLLRVINSLAPGLDESRVSRAFGSPQEAVLAAIGHIGGEPLPSDRAPDPRRSNSLKTVFGAGDFPTTAEKIYFPVDFGVARPAWRVLLWEPLDAFYVIVDAGSGMLLWRKNITEDQSQPATFDVYANASAFIDVADSPAPLTPGAGSPADGTQGILLARQQVSLVGNEDELGFNQNGWITDGANVTDGNAVEAGVDIDVVHGVDVPVSGINRVFSSGWNPPPGNPAPGDVPALQAARDGAVIQMFYVTNRYHDIMYQLGFTESAFNFQHQNFGKGGAEGDRISAEAQDSSGVNNANFSTPADGARGRMQAFVFSYADPDRDGTADAELLIHELTHGLSNRLHGNSSGLGTDMARAMGEGWSDFYAHALLAEPTDALDGVYPLNGYLMLGRAGIGTGNYYYGLRSLPGAILSSTGGPSNLPHNPLTFRDIDPAQADNSDGAFPARFAPYFASPHFRGEVWASALWEVRALMIQRLGFDDGTKRVLQVVTDGMKLAPVNPTFLQARDAIMAAAIAGSDPADPSADVEDVWEGFRIRGMGFSARVHSVANFSVTEAFDLPNAFIGDTGYLVSDVAGDNDSYAEPGETLSITVPLETLAGIPLTDVLLSINGGPQTPYGDMEGGSTVTREVGLVVPTGAGCGVAFDLDFSITSNRGTRQESRQLVLGEPTDRDAEDFDGVSAPALPAGWVTAKTGPGVEFVTTVLNASSAPLSAFTPNTGMAGGNAGATLESVSYPISSAGALLSFQNRFDTEAGWDGGVLEISLDGSEYSDIIQAGGSFIEGGYNNSLGNNQNPLDGRAAWSGNSGGYISTKVLLPAIARDKVARFRWRFGEDDNTSAVGWNIDDVVVARGSHCDAVPELLFEDGFE